MLQNWRARVPQVLEFGGIYQGAMVDIFFSHRHMSDYYPFGEDQPQLDGRFQADSFEVFTGQFFGT